MSDKPRCTATIWNGNPCKRAGSYEDGLCYKHLEMKCRKEGKQPPPSQFTHYGKRKPKSQVDYVKPEDAHYTKLFGEYGWWPKRKREVKVSDLGRGSVYLDEEGLPVVVTRMEGDVDGHRFWLARYIWQTRQEASWPDDAPGDATVWLAEKMNPYR